MGHWLHGVIVQQFSLVTALYEMLQWCYDFSISKGLLVLLCVNNVDLKIEQAPTLTTR